LVSGAAQDLAVRPVIELSVDVHQRRVFVTNKGNGPLLRPRLNMGEQSRPIITRDSATGEYRELGALATGTTAFAVAEDDDYDQEIAVSGWTMTGNEFRAVADVNATTSNVVVAIDASLRGKVFVAAEGGAKACQVP